MVRRSSASLAGHLWGFVTGAAVLLLCFVLRSCYAAGDGCKISWTRDFCAGSDSLCFPSTILSFGSGKEEECQDKILHDGDDGGYMKWHAANVAGFELANGDVVSCSVVDTKTRVNNRLKFNGKNAVEVDLDSSCKASLVPDLWMKMSSGMMPGLDEEGDDLDSGLHNASLSSFVEINPPFLDWGEVSLYSPSVLSLVVTNVDKNSILQVFEPFSTDPQFYPHEFGRLLLHPEESVSISFVFLPRLLGSVSAQVVLQTNLGGFIIQAKGVTIESPYKVEPLKDINIPFKGQLNKDLSLYNPFSDVLYVEEVTAWISSSRVSNQSVHIVCSLNSSGLSTNGRSNFLDDKEWLRVNDDQVVLPSIDIKPHKQWEVPSKSTQPILAMTLWHKLEGNGFGAICFKLRSLSLDSTDVVIVPLELKMQDKTIYKDKTDQVSVYLEPLVRHNGKRKISSLVLRNNAVHSLKVVNVCEVNEKLKFFVIKHIQDLIVFPATVTPIAFMSCTTAATQFNFLELLDESLKCMLSVVTNSSASPSIDIPCQDIIHACFDGEHSTGGVASEESYMGLLQQQEDESNGTKTGSLASISEVPSPEEVSGTIEANELILKNWRSQGIASDMSILEDHHLLFPSVHVGLHLSKWISVHNPSQNPVLVQLLLNPVEIVDQCKSADNISESTFYDHFTNLQSQERAIGFSLSDSGITEAFIHPSESTLMGPVLFRPSNRCLWTSSALLRNNLSGVETLHLQASGGAQVLILLEGSEPFSKLEFNFDLPTKLNISSTNLSFEKETTSTSCNHHLSKEINAKNIGELPLQVKKIKVSGTDCGLDGFKILNCEGFLLQPDESTKLLISYRSDFSTALISRNLELITASGMFVIPMTATVPVHAVNSCQKSFCVITWKVSFLVLFVVAILLVITVLVVPHSIFRSTQDYTILDKPISNAGKGGKSSRIQRASKNHRLTKDEGKPDAGSLHKYPMSQKSLVDSPSGSPSKKEIDENRMPFLTKSSMNKPIQGVGSSNVSVAPENRDLTIKVVKDRSRRRKKRGSGAILSGKLEISSSQSGNSTPPSPLSPNTSTPKQAWNITAESACVPSPGSSSERKQQKKHEVEFPTEINLESAERERKGNLALTDPEQSSTMNSTLAPLCTAYPFSLFCQEAPMVAPVLVPAYSKVAPDARAPGPKNSRGALGPKNSKGKSVEVEENNVVEREYTYDIWGNHFPTDTRGKPKEVMTEVLDASEGDHQSFFVRDPQSLMMMPSTMSEPHCQELTSEEDVTYKYQMK